MRKLAAAILVTALLGAGSIAPAQAQGFGIFFGDEPSDFFGNGHSEFQRQRTCMTDRQIRDAVASQGYGQIFLNVPNDRHIQVRATQDGVVYLLDFNYCTSQIESRQALRRAN